MTTPLNPIAALDVTTARLEASVEMLRLKRLTAGLEAEARHQLEPPVDMFTLMAVEHPERCSTAADYPGWVPPHLDTPERAA